MDEPDWDSLLPQVTGWIVQRVCHGHPLVPRDEAMSAAMVGIAVAAREWDPAKGSLKMWLYHVGRCRTIDELRRSSYVDRSQRRMGPAQKMWYHLWRETDLGAYTQAADGWPGMDSFPAKPGPELDSGSIDHLIGHLREEDRRLLKLYYVYGWTLEQIGEGFGLHQTSISLRHKGILKKLRKQLEPSHAT